MTSKLEDLRQIQDPRLIILQYCNKTQEAGRVNTFIFPTSKPPKVDSNIKNKFPNFESI